MIDKSPVRDIKGNQATQGCDLSLSAELLKPDSGQTAGLLAFPHPSPSALGKNPSVSAASSGLHFLQEPEQDGFAEWVDTVGVGDCAEIDPSLTEAFPLDDPGSIPNQSLQLETTGVTRQVTKGKTECGELWKKATTFKFSVAAKLREAGSIEDADTLEECHSRLVYAQCNGCRSVQIFRNRCDNFFCPECQPKLAKKRAAGVAWWVQQINQPKHVVLTVRNIPDLTKGHILEFKKWFTRLRHRKFARNWNGGFYSLEITNEGAGWHVHLHCLVDARWIDARTLSSEWAAVNGGCGHIVKVKDCRGSDYLKEVTKYAAKGSEIAGWTGTEIQTFIAALRGTKTFGVFGCLYGKRTEFKEWIKSLGDIKGVCKCGCAERTYYDENEWRAKDLILDSARHQTRPPPAVVEENWFDVSASRHFLDALRR